MGKKIGYGIVGCGEHAFQSHAKPALDIGELELVALCDPAEQAAAAFQAQLGLQEVSRYGSLKAFLDDPRVEAVVIASPDRFHAASLLDTVCSGRHVLCEKPLAADADGGQVMRLALDCAMEKRLVVSSCHPRRFDPPYVWVRQNLDRLRGDLGPVIAIDLDFSYHAPSAGKEGLHVGLLMDHMNHEFDLMTFLFGFSPVRCHKLLDGQVGYHVAGVRNDRVTFSFRGTRMLEARRYPEFLRIRFASGELDVNCENGEVRVVHHETGSVHTPRIQKTDYKARFTDVMRNFADAILGKTENYLAHDDLLRNTEAGIALTAGETWHSGP